MELKVLDTKKIHPSRYIALGIVFFVFLFFVVYSLGLNSKLRKEKEAELAAINKQIYITEQKTDDLKVIYNGTYNEEVFKEYVINKAHNDLDYVRKGERVFVIQ